MTDPQHMDKGELQVALRSCSQDKQQLEVRLSQVVALSERQAETLREAREQIVSLKGEVDNLSQVPNRYGVLLGVNDDETVDVFVMGSKMRVAVGDVDAESLQPGKQVVLNENMNVVAARDFEHIGESAKLLQLLENGEHALVAGHTDEERVVLLAPPLRELNPPLKVGDTLLLEPRSGCALGRIPKAEVEELMLEQVPDISYADIGGLAAQVEEITDAVELPYLYPDLFAEHELKPPKGVLLYGPPGCGKTLIAKAVANSLAKKVAAKTGEGGTAYFINIKGPELLNKYVGETERHIRLVFQRAREKSSDGTPVIVFFDEMDSLFRTRGSGVSSDVENTIVPQLLAELDGVEGLENVVVIGASNREDMIDPAVLRPGRLDVKIKIERPDAEAAADIFSKYLTTALPLHQDELRQFGDDAKACVQAMIRSTVEKMYKESEENEFLEVTYQGGDKEKLYFKDFNSGAMVMNIVDRAKKMAIKDFLDNDQKGLRVQHLLTACVDEFKENQDLPNTTNPADWAKISGKKGERIVFVRSLVHDKNGTGPGKAVENVGNTGQYL